MTNELYSYDKYKGFHIYITLDNSQYYGDIYENGTCVRDNVKRMTPESCLTRCEDIIDSWLEEKEYQ